MLKEKYIFSTSTAGSKTVEHTEEIKVNRYQVFKNQGVSIENHNHVSCY